MFGSNNVPSLKELVTDKEVVFKYFRDGELWYEVEGTGFIFPVKTDPIEVGNAMFKDRDRAIFFMRYIRKYRDAIIIAE